MLTVLTCTAALAATGWGGWLLLGYIRAVLDDRAGH